MRFINMRTSLAFLGFAALAACTAKSEKPVDTTMATTDTAMTTTSASSTAPAPAASTTASTTTAIVPININTATDAQILAIPGVGPRMLREFKEYRPYTSMDQFRREIGKYVDKAEVARLEQYITIK